VQRATFEETAVTFDEVVEGDYRIYAGALEAQQGDGYIAAVVVNRLCGGNSPREAFRDMELACGHRWRTSNEALRYSLCKGRDLVASEQHRLGC
jgi:hypothetical protein